MTEAKSRREALILEEIEDLSKYLEGIPEALRVRGIFEAYYDRLDALHEELIQSILSPPSLEINKTVLSVASLFDEPDDKTYWLSRVSRERLRHLEILRCISYGKSIAARFQRVLEFASLS